MKAADAAELKRALGRDLRVLKRRLVEVERQRDKAKGRVRELQTYVAKYQKDNAVLRRELRNA